MEQQEHALVSKMCCSPISLSCFVHFPCYLDIDECTMDTHNCDEALAVCLNTPAGSFTCRCIAGYTGSGTAGTCFGEYLDSFS